MIVFDTGDSVCMTPGMIRVDHCFESLAVIGIGCSALCERNLGIRIIGMGRFGCVHPY